MTFQMLILQGKGMIIFLPLEKQNNMKQKLGNCAGKEIYARSLSRIFAK